MNWYFEVLKKYAVFSGRARRKEYWMFFLINIIIAFVLGFVEGLLGGPGIISIIYFLTLLIPSIAVGVRRMHDTDHNGWWLLIPIVNFVLAVTEGTRGANRFGSNPKASSDSHEGPGTAGIKKCPQCAEDIKLEALICRYCRHAFSEEDVAAAIQKVQSSVAAAAAKRRPAEIELPSDKDLFGLALTGDHEALGARVAVLLSVYPKNPDGLYWRAFLEERNGSDRAAELYRTTSTRPFFDVADLWKKKGRLEEAERTLITLRDTHPEETKRATKALNELKPA